MIRLLRNLEFRITKPQTKNLPNFIKIRQFLICFLVQFSHEKLFDFNKIVILNTNFLQNQTIFLPCQFVNCVVRVGQSSNFLSELQICSKPNGWNKKKIGGDIQKFVFLVTSKLGWALSWIRVTPGQNLCHGQPYPWVGQPNLTS